MGRLLQRVLPHRLWMLLLSLRYRWFDLYKASSWSQEGEDMILRRVFETQPTGFYVDVGAHHPTRYSNTYYFYKLGWRGINIDATPGSMDIFRVMRPNDINIEAAVADRRSRLTFYQFNDPAMSTFDAALAHEREGDVFKIVDRRELETHTLAEVLAEHMPPNQAIDFLSIDVEGMDYAVLTSNDWQRFRPQVVVIECLGQTVAQVLDGEPAAFLRERGYTLLAKTAHTAFFAATGATTATDHA